MNVICIEKPVFTHISAIVHHKCRIQFAIHNSGSRFSRLQMHEYNRQYLYHLKGEAGLQHNSRWSIFSMLMTGTFTPFIVCCSFNYNSRQTKCLSRSAVLLKLVLTTTTTRMTTITTTKKTTFTMKTATTTTNQPP